jgi:hypothetical protein
VKGEDPVTYVQKGVHEEEESPESALIPDVPERHQRQGEEKTGIDPENAFGEKGQHDDGFYVPAFARQKIAGSF